MGGAAILKDLPEVLDKKLSDLQLLKPSSIEGDASIGEVRRVFRQSGARIVMVIDRRGMVEGVIYRSSVLRFTSAKSMGRARDIMEEPQVLASPGERVGDVLRLMLKYDEWYTPVVSEGGKLVGLFGLEIPIADIVSKRLFGSTPVREIMTREVDYVMEDESLTKVWELMVNKKYAGIPVVDRRGSLKGIITQHDLIKRGYTRLELESEGGMPRRIKASNAMTRPAMSLIPSNTVLEAAQLMHIRGIGRIPIVSDSETKSLLGIVDREDIVRLFFKIPVRH